MDIPEGFEEAPVPEGFELLSKADTESNVQGRALKNIASSAEGAFEAGVNTLVGAAAFPVALMGAPLSQAHQALKGTRDETMEGSFKRIMQGWTEPLYNESGEKGQEYTDWINNNIMPSLPALGLGNLAGIGHGVGGLRNPFRRAEKSVADNIPMPKTPEVTKAAIPEGFEEVGPPRPPLSVTPEGVAFDPRNTPNMDVARQAAAEKQRAGQLEQPMEMGEPYDALANPVDVKQFPQVLKDQPAQVPGLDMTEHNADRLARPLEQEMNTPKLPPEEAAWEGEGGNTTVASYSKPSPAAEYWNKRQRGAISIEAVQDTIRLFNKGMATGHDVLASYKGAFHPDEMEFMQRAIDNPGNRNSVVLMSPDEFHKYAAYRSADYLNNRSRAFGPDARRESVKEGLKSPTGLKEIPALLTRTNDGVAQIIGHEGRHRMDVFKEMGIEQVPVMIRDTKEGWGKAHTLVPEDQYVVPNAADRKGVPFPPILNKVKGPRSQQGNINLKDLADALQNGMDKIGEVVEKLGKARVSPYTDKEKVVLDSLGTKTFIPKGDKPETIVANALKEGKDGEALFQNVQSGLSNAAEKVQSAAMQGVARWLSYGNKMGERLYRNNVRPVEQAFARLNKTDLITGQTLLRNEMFARRQYSESELSSMGLSKKALEAHQLLRKAFDKALEATNDSLLSLGKEPIKPADAYMASMWQGNWHMPVFGKDGKLAWYLKLETKAEAQRALEWMKKNGMDNTLNLEEAKIEHHPVNVGSRVPRDVMGAYQDMLQYFDGDVAQQMKAAMEAYTQEKAFTFQQHQKHFENKANIRGFQGDRPWLSEHDNAMAQAKAQFSYLREAFEWAPMQEALANVKEVIANPELNKQQPNNMELTKNYTAQALGVSKNMLRAFEQETQKFMTSMPNSVMKVIPTSISRFVHSLKTMTYLQQLGLSGGYMIATPLQAFLLGPAWHAKLSGEGFKHNVVESASKALYDFSLGLIGHEIKNSIHQKFDMPMSKIGKDAFEYMEDNGIISQNIFHENSGFGDYKPVHAVKSVIGWTISMPEKIARASTFMSFVHHLDASGKYTSKAELFQRADELTNHVLTNFNREARPLVVDKFGQAGELFYTYKSALFNQYNNLGIFARDAMKGKPGALLGALFMTSLLAGSQGFPGVNELDNMWNGVKEVVSNKFPSLYPSLSGHGIKGSIIKHMNEFAANAKVQEAIGAGPAHFLANTANYGLPSAATNTQLASRFSSAVGDLNNPIDNMFPPIQQLGEWGKAAGALASPNETSLSEAAHNNAPSAIQGAMENQMDIFKTVKQQGGQGYANPAKLAEHATSYVRTPKEEAVRYLGMRSLDEATTKSDRFINNQESARLHQAQDASMRDMFDAVIRKDPADVKKYALAYFENNGAENFERDLDAKVDAYAFTPEQRSIIKAQSIAALKNVQRFRRQHLGQP